MRTIVVSSLLVLACSLRARAGDARAIICDDGSVPSTSCGFVLPDPDDVSICPTPEILALQRGCFVCVDAATCNVAEEAVPETPAAEPVVPDAAIPQEPEVKEAAIAQADATAAESPPETTSPARLVPSNLVILPSHDQLDHAGEKDMPIYPLQAAAQVPDSNGIQARGPRPAMQEVSNWYFLIPAFLALVSVGIALRGRVEQHRAFERLGDEDQDEINPFCGDHGNPQMDDDDLEFGKPCDSDNDSGDDATRR